MADRIVKTSKNIDLDSGSITISFPSSGTEETITVKLADLPESNQLRLAMHGLSQKLGDATAGAELDECLPRVKAVAEALMDPDGWTTRVAGAGGPRTTQLAEALAAVTGKSVEEAAAVVNDLDDEQKKELRANAQIKAKLAEIKAAAAAKAAEKAAAAAASGEAGGMDLTSLMGGSAA